jgi:Ca2+-binding EF-hand superfamily protein
LDKLEFEEMCSQLGVFMTTQELTCVYNSFDKNRDGHVCYDEFINTIRVSGDWNTPLGVS